MSLIDEERNLNTEWLILIFTRAKKRSIIGIDHGRARLALLTDDGTLFLTSRDDWDGGDN